jgi:hypothetical protein
MPIDTSGGITNHTSLGCGRVGFEPTYTTAYEAGEITELLYPAIMCSLSYMSILCRGIAPHNSKRVDGRLPWIHTRIVGALMPLALKVKLETYNSVF